MSFLEKRVWYAAYGSNLNQDRLMCYLEGRKPEGAHTEMLGSRDSTPPEDISTFESTHELYFAEMSATWKGGVAFIIDDESTTPTKTLFKLYDVGPEQFKDIAHQECGLEPGKVNISLEVVKRKGYLDFCDGRYDRILYLGDKGYPIFTVTSSIDRRDSIQEPSENYLHHIVNGLKSMGLTENDISDYLLDKRGVRPSVLDGILNDKTDPWPFLP